MENVNQSLFSTSCLLEVDSVMSFCKNEFSRYLQRSRLKNTREIRQRIDVYHVEMMAMCVCECVGNCYDYLLLLPALCLFIRLLFLANTMVQLTVAGRNIAVPSTVSYQLTHLVSRLK
jgi:hypothetical protein